VQVIDENTIVVTTSEELNKVLSEQNTYTYIYLGNDITMSSGSIINNTKNANIWYTNNPVSSAGTSNFLPSYSNLILVSFMVYPDKTLILLFIGCIFVLIIPIVKIFLL
jgi:hypothetical protein